MVKPVIKLYHDPDQYYLKPVDTVNEDAVNVFISYSQEDEDYASEIAYCLQEVNRCLNIDITYCTDVNSRHEAEEYCNCNIVSKLIKSCNVFVYIGSEDAYASEYAFRKVHYAVDVAEGLNKQERNKCVLTLLDGDPKQILPSSLMFLLSNVNHRQKANGVFPILIKDITRQLGLEYKATDSQIKYDVFISYSHRDVKFIDSLKYDFEYAAVRSFSYENDISGGENYLDEISHAIDVCEVFLFVGSKNSYNSKYTLKELFYALKTKGADQIIIVKSDSEPIPPSIALLTTGVSQVGNTQLYSVLYKYFRNAARPKYKVGEKYEFGNHEGVVFMGEESGLGLTAKEYECQWCKDSPLINNYPLGLDVPEFPNEPGELDGEFEGFTNRRAFKRFPLAKLLFPAYGCCADMDSVWYLPNILELQYLYLGNDALVKAGVPSLEEDVFYWSSTEYEADPAYAWGCVFKRDSRGNLYSKTERRRKTEIGRVRGMLSFGNMIK